MEYGSIDSGELGGQCVSTFHFFVLDFMWMVVIDWIGGVRFHTASTTVAIHCPLVFCGGILEFFETVSRCIRRAQPQNSGTKVCPRQYVGLHVAPMPSSHTHVEKVQGHLLVNSTFLFHNKTTRYYPPVFLFAHSTTIPVCSTHTQATWRGNNHTIHVGQLLHAISKRKELRTCDIQHQATELSRSPTTKNHAAELSENKHNHVKRVPTLWHQFRLGIVCKTSNNPR